MRHLGMFSGGVGFLGSLLSLGGSDLLVIGGALVFAVATWRSKSNEVLRKENTDLSDRNTTVEAQVLALRAENVELKARPDVERLYELMRKHDERSQEFMAQVVKTLERIDENLRANAEAVRLWATMRAAD